MLAATILLVQLRCAPNASGTVDCYDTQKGGAAVLKIEPNLFGRTDLRHSDGRVERCEKRASGETECRVLQEGKRSEQHLPEFRRPSLPLVSESP